MIEANRVKNITLWPIGLGKESRISPHNPQPPNILLFPAEKATKIPMNNIGASRAR